MTQEPSAMLAIEGGPPLAASPWPAAPRVEPATDARPVEALEAAIADVLGLPPEAVIAYRDRDEAYRAVLGALGRTAERDEAVVPALFADEAAAAARLAGWRVVPADVEADTGALSAGALARVAAERTGLVIVAHPSGHPAAMPDLLRAAAARDVPMVEEITGAFGASFRDVPVGRFGTAAVLRGRAGDPISRGAFAVFADGSTTEAADAARERREAVPGLEDAAVALAEVRTLEEELLWRRRIAWEITLGLRGMRAASPMPHSRWIRHAYARYVLRLRTALWKRPLADTVAAIRAEGVPCAPAASLPQEGEVGEDMHPVGTRLPGELVAIPLHSGLTSREADLIAAVLRKVEANSL